jgi:hypothetical protein
MNRIGGAGAMAVVGDASVAAEASPLLRMLSLQGNKISTAVFDTLNFELNVTGVTFEPSVPGPMGRRERTILPYLLTCWIRSPYIS